MSTEYPTIARVVTKLTNRLLGMMSYLVWFLLKDCHGSIAVQKCQWQKRQDVSQLQIAKPRTWVDTWPIGETVKRFFLFGPFPRVTISVGSPPVAVVAVVVVVVCCLLFVVCWTGLLRRTPQTSITFYMVLHRLYTQVIYLEPIVFYFASKRSSFPIKTFPT